MQLPFSRALLGWLAPGVEVQPSNLVYIRVSRKLLEQCMETSFECETTVDDEILGTVLSGKAYTHGIARIDFEDDETQAVIHLSLSGTVSTTTLGRNGPVVLHNQAMTRFDAAKTVVLSANGVCALPAAGSAETKSTTTKIETRFTGLRGRIVERVARRRADELRSQADAIAAQHTSARINTLFDERVDSGIARLERSLVGGLAHFVADEGQTPHSIRYRSAADHLEVIVHRPQFEVTGAACEPPAIEGDPEIAVRAHRCFVRQALARRDFAHSLQSLVAGLLQRRAGAEVLTAAAPPSGSFGLKWSPDGNWLTLTYNRAKAPHAPPAEHLPVAEAIAETQP